jgi:hypothetical protein
MSDPATYYRYIEPPVGNAKPPSNYQREAYDYAGFIIARVENPDYLHYRILTSDWGLPPLELRSSFTDKLRAEKHLTDWWDRENKKKEAALAAKTK